MGGRLAIHQAHRVVSKVQLVTGGVPQGSMLQSLLFNSLDNGMDDTLSFADDAELGEQSICWRAGLLFTGTSTGRTNGLTGTSWSSGKVKPCPWDGITS